MSQLRVPVVAVRGVEPVRDAERIELAVVGDFRSIVLKESVAPGMLVAYLPASSLVPEWILRRLNLWDDVAGHGRLSGEGHNRVGVKRLRSTVSEGLVLPLEPGSDGGTAVLVLEDGQGVPVREGDDLASLLGVTKWRPTILPELSGHLADISGHTVRFDIEDRKAYPDVIAEGEMVAYTEKVHGVFAAIGVIPGLGHHELFHGGDVFVGSKDWYGQGLVFTDTPANDCNRYVRTVRMLRHQIEALVARAAGEPLTVMGEIYGPGVQRRYAYGRDQAAGLGYRVFSVYQGTPERGRYLNFDDGRALAAGMGFDTVDLLYRGPHSPADMVRHRDGPSVTGRGAHIREGLIITPLHERIDHQLGRVVLKEVSPAYLGKTDGTELS